MIIKYVNDVVKRLKIDLSKTRKLDLFDIKEGDLDSEEKKISLIDPKPLDGQSQEEFEKMLVIEKNKARKNKIKAMILDITYREGFEDRLGPYIYEKISQEVYYTRYPQEIGFVSCFRCIYSNKMEIKKNNSGGLLIERNSVSISGAKALQSRYNLDMYGKIQVVYESRQLRFQILFYNAKTNKVMWGRTYVYYIKSLDGGSFTMDLGINFLASRNNNVSSTPIGGDLRLGGRFEGIGSTGFRFYLGGGFSDTIGVPEIYLLNGYFDWMVSDLFPHYGNKVSWVLGFDLGMGIQTFLTSESAVFFNLELYTSLFFVESAYMKFGVLTDVGKNSTGNTQLNPGVGPAFMFSLGVIIF